MQSRNEISSSAARSRSIRLLYEVKPYLGMILVFAFVLSGIAAIIVNSITPVWQASATILVPPGPVSVANMANSDGKGTENDAEQQGHFATQLQVLASRRLAEKVVAGLSLIEQSEYQLARTNDRSWLAGLFSTNNPLPTADPLQVATDIYMEHLHVAQVD
ncbi:MAG: Wzz/FepE/Etk N-terminal domain-containing protein, partial [Gammaproteobacteria bacterium]